MRFVFSEAARALRANPLMAGFSVMSSTLLFLILGLGGVMTGSLSSLLAKMWSEVELMAFMREGVSQGELALATSLVSQLAGVDGVEVVEAERVLGELMDQYPELGEIGGEELPLPPSLRVRVAPHWRKSWLLGLLAEKVALVPGVEEVYYGEEFLEPAERFYRASLLVDAALLLVVFVSATFIISQAIRIALLARKEVMGLANLMGAPAWRIKAPFLLLGCAYGAFGGLLASPVLLGLGVWVSRLMGVGAGWLPWTLAGVPALGCAIGLLASYTATGEAVRC